MENGNAIEFTFYNYLYTYYNQNKGKIRSYYKELTKKILDYNNPVNACSWLRVPQYEALEIYIFLKEYLGNRHLAEIFLDWRNKTGRFQDRSDISLFEELDKKTFDDIFATFNTVKQDYANYIFALTMGVGKTLLMATCIFYEFLLANKFSKDKCFCHNALIFAPDKTVLQSLREIEAFDKTRVVPPEYAHQLDTMMKFHFLDDSGITLNTIDGDMFNLIISNTQKIILKRQQKEPGPADRLFQGEFDTIVESDPEFAELVALAEITDENLTSNQRFKKLSRLPQLGIYVDESHHAFGAKLEKDLYDRKKTTSLRLTIDGLAKNLERQGTHVVACYNFTGTPYSNNRLLPEVVYSYSLSQAINAEYLKQVNVTGFVNAKSREAVKAAVTEFRETHKENRYEFMLPKIAFFTATIKELETELRPAVEEALTSLGISLDKILVNVGDDKLTSNDDIREFNNLDSPHSEKQFILLVNKGKEGWNCRSLFAVCMFRKPKSTIFVLQAAMRCLRSITNIQQEGHVYLSQKNEHILEKELEDNFHMSLKDLTDAGTRKKKAVRVKPTEPPVKVTLRQRRKKYEVRELQPATIILDMDKLDFEKYRIYRTEKNILDMGKKIAPDTDITSIREQREYSEITFIAEIARYLNKPCLEIKEILNKAKEGIDEMARLVTDYNDILYDWIIPKLFHQLYKINEFILEEEKEVTLVNPPEDEKGFLFTVFPELLAPMNEKKYSRFRNKSFHLDHYCFDSKPEIAYFWQSLNNDNIEKIYFTGMLTHGQSDFMISYIDPESHTLRHYFPDFLIKQKDGHYTIVEIKGDNKLDDPVVQAKKEYAQSLALINNMQYEVIAGSDALQGSGDK